MKNKIQFNEKSLIYKDTADLAIFYPNVRQTFIWLFQIKAEYKEA